MDASEPFPPFPSPKRRRWPSLAAGGALALILALVGTLVEIPYYTLGPGPARDVAELVRISGERVYPSKGSFVLTTVAVSPGPVSLFGALEGWLDPAVAVVHRDAVISRGLTDRQQDQLNAQLMEQSKYEATVVGLKAAGFTVKPLAGARVVSVVPDAPADGQLVAGDLIIEVDGARVRDVPSTIAAIRKRRVGAAVALEVLRGEERKRLTLRSAESPTDKGVPIVGASLAPAFRLPFEVSITSFDIGGPSAGLMFALAVADVLTPDDLTRGRRVAGTGTIDLSGKVGGVGGVALKVAAAEQVGAEVFLVPKKEVEEATRAATEVTVIGVGTLDEALAALRSLGEARPAA